MFFITYSEQIMHLSFALGALLVSVALAWLLFTALSIIRDIKHVIDKVKHTINLVHEVTGVVKQKVHDFHIQFQALSSGFTTIMDWMNKNKENYTKTTEKQNTENKNKAEEDNVETQDFASEK